MTKSHINRSLSNFPMVTQAKLLNGLFLLYPWVVKVSDLMGSFWTEENKYKSEWSIVNTLLQLLSIHWICIYICKLVQTQWWTIASNDKHLYNTDYIVNTTLFKLGGNPFCDLKLERSVYSEEVISSLSSKKKPSISYAGLMFFCLSLQIIRLCFDN